MAGASKPVDVSTKQRRIARLARQSPEMAFTSLAYYIDIDWLLEAILAPVKTEQWAWTDKMARTMQPT